MNKRVNKKIKLNKLLSELGWQHKKSAVLKW